MTRAKRSRQTAEFFDIECVLAVNDDRSQVQVQWAGTDRAGNPLAPEWIAVSDLGGECACTMPPACDRQMRSHPYVNSTVAACAVISIVLDIAATCRATTLPVS
jgi:hypothetical protein